MDILKKEAYRLIDLEYRASNGHSFSLYPHYGLSDLIDCIKVEIKNNGKLVRWNNKHSKALVIIAINSIGFSGYSNKLYVYTGESSFLPDDYYNSVLKLNYRSFNTLITELENLHYLEYRPGGIHHYKNKSGGNGRSHYPSRLIILDKFYNLLNQYIDKDKIRVRPDAVVRLRVVKADASNGRSLYKYYQWNQNRLSMINRAFTRQSVIKHYNSLLANTEILIALPGELSSNIYTISKLHKSYNRTYHEHVSQSEQFTQHGRLYAPFQNMDKHHRQYSLFDGECTVEIDIVSSHVMLAYALNGIDFTKDANPGIRPAYNLDGIATSKTGTEEERLNRVILKQSIMMLFNCTSSYHASLALLNWFAKEHDKVVKSNASITNNKIKKKQINYYAALNKIAANLPNYNIRKAYECIDRSYDARIVVEAIKAKHPSIENWFKDKRANAKLTFIESEVIMDVVEHFTALKIPCMVIHDSVVIPQSAARKLNQVLIESISERTGIIFKDTSNLTDFVR